MGTVSALRSAQAVIEGIGKNKVSGLDPATANRVLTLDWKQGSPSTLRDLGDGEAILDDAFASDHGLGGRGPGADADQDRRSALLPGGRDGRR